VEINPRSGRRPLRETAGNGGGDFPDLTETDGN
jgi:hypothetical protein